LLKGLFSPGFSEESLQSVAEENLKFPRDHASELLRDTAFGDWRDVIKRIELPTLVVFGRRINVLQCLPAVDSVSNSWFRTGGIY